MDRGGLWMFGDVLFMNGTKTLIFLCFCWRAWSFGEKEKACCIGFSVINLVLFWGKPNENALLVEG